MIATQYAKEVKSNPKQPSCAAPKKAILKKDAKSKVVAKKWLDGKLMEKFLIMTIHMNLCCLLHISLGFGTKFTWIVISKIFAISLPSNHFLAATLAFFTMGATHFFLQLGCFGLDICSTFTPQIKGKSVDI